MDKDPYEPPELSEQTLHKGPGSITIFFILLASFVAWVATFFGTCFGLFVLGRTFGNDKPVSMAVEVVFYFPPFFVA